MFSTVFFKDQNTLSSNFNRNSLGVDLNKYLKNNEKKIPDIKTGVEKRIIWSNQKKYKNSNFNYLYSRVFG